jgi:hypothetical protein
MEKPALPPPPGQTSDFINPPSLTPYVILCFSVCLPITTAVFALRTWTRVIIKRTWILEDYFCTLAWMTLVIFSAFVITVIHHWGGIHEWDLDSSEVSQALFWSNAAQIEYAFVMLLTKVGILMMYRRVFVTSRWNPLDWVIKVMMAIITCFYIATTLAKIFSCTPRAKIWDSTIPGTCLNTAEVLIANGIFNVITDTIMLVIPIKSVWNLQISRRKKIGVIVIFSVGSTAPVFSIIGLVMRLKYVTSLDKTYTQVIIHMWATAEVVSGFICLCGPEIAPIFRNRFAPASSHAGLYYTGSGSKPPRSRLRDPSISLEEVDLFPDGGQDAEKGQGRSQRDQAHTNSGVVSHIRGGLEMSSQENINNDRMAPFPENEIGVVTTVTLEHS